MKNEHSASRKSRSTFWARPATRVGALAALICALLIGIYVGVAQVLVPRIVADSVARYLAAMPGRELTFERLGVEPFSLRVEVGAVRGYEPPVAFDASRVMLDLDVSTLFTGRLVVAAFDIEHGELRVPESQGAPEREHVVRDVAVSARELERNGLAGGRYRVRIGDLAAARVELAGELGDAASVGTGHLELLGLDLARLQDWVPALEPVALRGRLDLRGEYRWPLRSDRLSLEIERGAATISSLEMSLAPNLAVQADSLATLMTGMIVARGPTVDGNLRVELTDTRFQIVDSHFAPPIRHAIEQAKGTVAAASVPATELKVEIEGDLASSRRSAARLAATIGGGERALAFTAADVDATTLSPYALATVDRGLAQGRVDLDLAYTGAGSSLGTLGLRTVGLELDGTAREGSLDFAQALLEDEHGVLNLEVPLTSELGSKPDPAAAMAAAIRERIDSIVGAPVEAIAPLVDADPATLGSVPFEPGIAAVAPTGAAALDTLAEALRRRPRLGLDVPGGFDREADRDALARQQVELHVSLATAGPTLRARPEPIDFGSARAQDVLDEFAGERLSAARIADIAARFPGGKAGPSTAPKRIEYYRALFDALVANETIGMGALRRIGRYRAQAVREALAARGIEAERITVGDGTAAAAWDEPRDAVRVHVEFAMPAPAADAPSDRIAEATPPQPE